MQLGYFRHHCLLELVFGYVWCNVDHQLRSFEGDWVAWVGTWDDLMHHGRGQYLVRIKDNKKGYDTTYPGVEVLPNGEFVLTTYGHWVAGEEPYILSVRLGLNELDAKSR